MVNEQRKPRARRGARRTARLALRAARGWISRSTENMLELARLDRSTPAAALSFEVADRTRTCRLRHYAPAGPSDVRAPLLLVPPLMLTAEIYDVAPDTSALRQLTGGGIDCWVVDFGAPEREEGGMQRTLDDHVCAVGWAVGRVRELTGRDVHVAGYSQGGLFAYQAAAYLRGEGVASLITFGSPVDIHKNLPNIASDIAARFLRAASPMVDFVLESIEGIPGILSSVGFKVLSPKKELEQLVDFLFKLNDREERARRESRRRFLSGEGFVAWPGPALKSFFDQFVVHNRMVSGGFVIDGRSVALSDIRAPILAFVGTRDEFARPASVRAIKVAAPLSEIFEIELRAGHFGLVVGSLATRVTWPSVIEWLRWREGAGPEPRELIATPPESRVNDEAEEYFEVDFDYQLLEDEFFHAVSGRVAQVATALRDAGTGFDRLRWQLPRLRRLERMTGATRMSVSLVLAEQAAKIGAQTFFLWRGRAFTYAQANARVDAVSRGLIAAGVEAGQAVLVLMDTRPSFLSMTTALNRIGAVAVLPSSELDDDALGRSVLELGVSAIACDPEHAGRAAKFAGKARLLVLGGVRAEATRSFDGGAVDLEAIDPGGVSLPASFTADPGRAESLAFLFVQRGRGGEPQVSRITNGRWAFSALGVAASATLRPDDTVLCCLPLHHPTGLLVATGGALVGGCRLALTPGLDTLSFWSDARHCGATVVFYAGDMVRAIVEAPVIAGERSHPVRLFAGSGMRVDVWQRVCERFGVGVLELYASTERNLVLANASGAKVGSVGRPLPGSAEIALCEYDFVTAELARRDGPGSRVRRVEVDQPGLALSRLHDGASGPEVLSDVFAPGDRWHVTDDVLYRDRDGDYWFVDTLSNFILTARGPVASTRVEDALHGVFGVRRAVVYAGKLEAAVGDGGVGSAEVPLAVVRGEQPLDLEALGDILRAELAQHERPVSIARVASLPMNAGYRVLKSALRLAGATPDGCIERFVYEPSTESYRRA
ncbi:MAG: alpha/beta fold hydrolase [Myxococcales bacterium]|nr:alpha/beta fold hydrolase [Myxococcales bacterium]